MAVVKRTLEARLYGEGDGRPIEDRVRFVAHLFDGRWVCTVIRWEIGAVPTGTYTVEGDCGTASVAFIGSRFEFAGKPPWCGPVDKSDRAN